jgi:HK97 family phage major capsid protein
VPIPAELRADEVTKTTDLTAAIPVPLANRIIETLESTGMILPLVTKSAFPAGVKIPTSSVKPVATWVNEGAGSDRQKKTVTTSIDFTHYKLRCEIAMTQEAATMALPAFEATFVRQVSEAMTKAIESAIIKGAWNLAGNTLVGPKGILDETPSTGQALTAKNINYELLVNAEAALPQAYEANARWCMTKKTFMAFVGMTDAEGQPIARINYGIGGRPERTLLGREVILCGDYMDSFSASLEQGKIFAFLFNFSDYVLNTNYDLGVQRKQDWDTEDWLTKAVMAVDGKVIDKNSLVTIAKSA